MVKLVVILGSGTMGSAIAVLVASSGTEVMLLDRPSEGPDRNKLASAGLKAASRFLTSENDLDFINVGNFEDDLEKISKADWIIEAIIENIDAKVLLFSKIAGYVSEAAVVSSNTSTIPLAKILEQIPDNIANKFAITHFFNPPRFLPLLEAVYLKKFASLDNVLDFCVKRLGRKPVVCHDTPGFIANRIGFFWMYNAIILCMEKGLKIEVADHLLSSGCMGIPGTGVFGLVDLIGLDVFSFIMKSLINLLPPEDELCKISKTEIAYFANMLEGGRIGKKAGVGFYRKKSDVTKATLQVLDLKSGTYNDVDQSVPHKLPEFELFNDSTPEGAFLTELFARTLSYVLNLMPSVAINPNVVDNVMKFGYSWKYGLFQMIDNISQKLPADFFLERMQNMGLSTKGIMSYKKPFYIKSNFLDVDGKYKPYKRDFPTISDMTDGKKAILENLSASLLDIGDGIALFKIKTKGNNLDLSVFKLLYDAINITGMHFDGMVIGTEDNVSFSMGANLVYLINHFADQLVINNFLSYGQNIMSMLKKAKFPVISAVSGYAIGGGFELMLHSKSVVAFIESRVGFAECKIGLIPSWGGCKEMLLRVFAGKLSKQDAYNIIFDSVITSSAKGLEHLLGYTPEIVMNVDELIFAAKNKALSLVKQDHFVETESVSSYLSSGEDIVIPNFEKLYGHRKKVAICLKNIFEVDNFFESRILKRERESFISLLQNEEVRVEISKKIHI